MPGRPYVLEEAALRAVRERPVEVAVLPWGATEPHNLHLPFGTDTIQASEVAVEAARIAWASGAGVMVLPAIPIGANAQQLDTPMTLNLNPSTQALVLEDLVASLERHGVAKLVIVNGHGGNDFRQMIRELQARTTVFLSVVSWYSVIPPDEHFDEPGDHAGELETSVMMHLRPDWVHPLEDAGAGEARVFRIRALREGWAWAPRDWSQVTDDTGVGDPRASTPNKGLQYLEAVTREIGGFLSEMAAADVSDLYALPGEVEP
jgi:creatinine amidohydrolase